MSPSSSKTPGKEAHKVIRDRFIRGGAVLATAVAMSLACATLSGCSPEAKTEETDSEMPVEVFVRGAAPGGMTASWEGAGGRPSLVLGDDGTATWDGDGGKAEGTWLMSGPTDGELMLSDGRSLRLELDEGTDTLSAILIEGGKDSKRVSLSRVGDEGDGADETGASGGTKAEK